MAMTFFGHMGIEWNLLKEPQEDIDLLRVWVEDYKRHRDDFAAGTVVHGDGSDPAVRLDGVVSADKSRAVYRFTQLTTSAAYPAAPVRLPGLDEDAAYRVRPLPVSMENGRIGTWAGSGQSPLGWWNEDGIVMDAQALQAYGIRPPALHPAQAVLIEAVRV